LEEIYLGNGTELSFGDYHISTNDIETSASLKIRDGKILVSCNKEVTISIKNQKWKVLPGKDFMIRN
jgi:mannose-6-phosphate isomerase class I